VVRRRILLLDELLLLLVLLLLLMLMLTTRLEVIKVVRSVEVFHRRQRRVGNDDAFGSGDFDRPGLVDS